MLKKTCEIKYILNKSDSLFHLITSWLLIKSEETTKASYIVTIEQIILQDKLSLNWWKKQAKWINENRSTENPLTGLKALVTFTSN